MVAGEILQLEEPMRSPEDALAVLERLPKVRCDDADVPRCDLIGGEWRRLLASAPTDAEFVATSEVNRSREDLPAQLPDADTSGSPALASRVQRNWRAGSFIPLW